MSIPEKLSEPFHQTKAIINSFLHWISFCVMDTGRDPEYVKNHLLYVLVDEYLESLVAVLMLIEQGIHKVSIRDSRFILEMSIKMAHIQQVGYNLTIDQKLENFKKELSSPSIAIMKKIDLSLLGDSLKQDFLEETGRLFGYSSEYVHLTPNQVSARISLIETGRSTGNEEPDDLQQLNKFLERIYAVSIVFMMHSVPGYISGDWFVYSNGDSNDWYFKASKFVAAIDEKFDYKHERKSRLKEIKEIRLSHIRF